MYTRLYITIVMLLLNSINLSAQEQLTPKQKRHLRPQYIQVGIGADRGSVRDFATSPLTYKGILTNYTAAYLKMDNEREVKLNMRFNNGVYKYKNTSGVRLFNKANVYVLDVNYYRLYQVHAFNNSKWNLKVGGTFDINTDVRINQDLMNAAVGYEVFNTLFVSGKVSRRFERKEAVTKKILFMHIRFRPMVAFLSYRLNVPVMNNTVRNGFSYIANESINTLPIFKEYKVKAFSGVHFSSELAYTRQMQNGNMWRLSYIWDAYAAGKTYDRIEMAHHIAELSILFHLNKQQQ